MSYNHENVIWQSPDGTWNRGFFAEDYLTCGGNDDECGDETHEWCREFDHNTFEWVSAGHPSEEAAWRSWDGSNPGGHTTYRYDPERPEATIEFEDMAAVLYERAREKAASNNGGGWSMGTSHFARSNQPGYWGYHGPAKQRSLAAIQKERLDNRLAWVGHRLGGYANGLDDERDKRLLAQCKERLKTATPAEKDAYWKAMADHAAAVRQKKVERDERKAEEARRNSRFGMYRGYDSRAAGEAAARRARQEAADAEVEAWAERIERAVADTKAPPKTPEPTPEPAATAPAKEPAAKKASPKATVASGTTRRKTTAKSTPGSFASRTHGESDVALAPAPVAPAQPAYDPNDPWGAP